MKRLTLSFLLATVVLATGACEGTRTRSTNVSFSLSDVKAELGVLKQQAVDGGQSNAITDLNTFETIANNPDSTIYYASAPSDMGKPSVVAPLDYGALNGSTASGLPN